MSFREIKTFTEKMRGLGYPRPISMESFRTPNFELVADILFWLVKNYDPSIDVTFDISTEHDRVHLIKSIATFMAPKAHVKLNTRKLYMADGYAVRELLKIADLLYEAHKIQPEHDEHQDTSIVPPLDISNKIGQLKTSRTLASEITERGAQLYDLLQREIELRETRTSVISKPFELEAMERSVNDAISKLRGQISISQTGIENLNADETNLMAKIEKKKVELDRAEKRLKSLQGVRPAYMDEYEKIEVELMKLYDTYMDKFRNLAYLEQQLDEHNREEQDKFEETESSLRKMQNKLREEELRLLRGEKEVSKDSGSGARSGRPQRPAAAGSRSNGLNAGRVDSGSDSGRGRNGDIDDDDDEDDDGDVDDDDDEDDGVSIGTGVSSGEIQQDDDDEIFNSTANLGSRTNAGRRGMGDNEGSARNIRPKRAGENGRPLGSGSARPGAGSNSRIASGAGNGNNSGNDVDSRRQQQRRGEGGLSGRRRIGTGDGDGNMFAQDGGRASGMRGASGGRVNRDNDSDEDDDDDDDDDHGNRNGRRGLRGADIDRDEDGGADDDDDDDDDVLGDSSEDLLHGSDDGQDDDNEF